MTADRKAPDARRLAHRSLHRPEIESYSDAREQRIRQVRRRLAAGVYDTGAVRDELAWRLARVLRDVPLEDL